MVMRVSCSICWKLHTSRHESVWLFLRGRDARLLLDYILDRAQLAFVVGRETSNTCQGFRLKALSSLTSAPCKKCLIDRYLLHENTRTNAHAYILCFSKFYYAFIYREKKQNVNSSHSCGQIRPFFFTIFPSASDRARIIETISIQNIFLTHRHDISLRMQTVSVSRQWGVGLGGWEGEMSCSWTGRRIWMNPISFPVNTCFITSSLWQNNLQWTISAEVQPVKLHTMGLLAGLKFA